jgi:FdrA protein
VLLLDVVLGHGAHPDPAAELAPAIRTARETRRDLPVIVALIGTRDDPQGRDRQATALNDAGADVHLSNADAARTAVGLLSGSDT